jgi:hypothetical protein
METINSGYGSGSGSGSGYGYGYGDGYGDGDGYGYGSGSGDFIEYLAALLDPWRKEHDQAVLAFWRSNRDGTPANGGIGSARFAGMVEEIPGKELRLCCAAALHATVDPKQWQGDRWWVVALYPPLLVDDNKLGACRRKIVQDLGPCPF